MGPNLKQFVDVIRPFMAGDLLRQKCNPPLRLGLPDYEIIAAEFPESESSYWQMFWHYEVGCDRLFQFGHLSNIGINHLGIEEPLKNVDELLASRWYNCHELVWYRLRMGADGPWLHFDYPLTTGDWMMRDATLLDLAVAGWHGEDVSAYFLDRLLEVGGRLAEAVERGILSRGVG